MKAGKIIFYLALVFFFSGAVYFAWQIWQKRYDYFFQGKQLDNSQNNSSESNTPVPLATISASVSPEPSPNGSQQEETIQDILENHCSQNCRRKVDVAEKKYCLEICGLNQPEQVTEESDCAKLSGQEADICWKNLAIKKKSGSYCDKIENKGIKESCQNRLVEEFLK